MEYANQNIEMDQELKRKLNWVQVISSLLLWLSSVVYSFLITMAVRNSIFLIKKILRVMILLPQLYEFFHSEYNFSSIKLKKYEIPEILRSPTGSIS